MNGLRDELHRIGDTASTANVPDDTWARARRARRRERALVLAGGVAVLAVVAALVIWVPDLSDPQPVGTGRTGVPETIWGVPAGVFTADDASSDLTVGRAAVAMTTEDNIPVVIGATDGVYHPLRLPGFGRFDAYQGVLSLSPDGRQLAWPWSGAPGDATSQTPTGIRIVDLETGQQRSIPLTGGKGVVVYQILWSPDSSWLVWDGNDAAKWSDRGYSAGPEAAGRVAPGATTSERVPRTDEESTRLAIGNDGTVLIATADDQTLWDGDAQETQSHPSDWYPAALTAEDGVLLQVRVRSPSADEYTIDYRVVTPSGPVPAPDLAQLGLVPQGLLGDGALAAFTAPVSGSVASLSLIDLSDGGLREVGESDASGQVTVAVDLMSAENPTVERPEPAWLDIDDGRAATTWLLLGGAVVALVVAAAVVVRRYRRSVRNAS